MQRRIAAILVADVVGYARLVEADEAGTLTALRERRKTLVEPLAREHGGRVVKYLGDGVLIEFASAVNAVACALALQAGMEAANEGLPENRRIVLRIGSNLGDVVGEGSDIFGDGVNIAARVEAAAEPGGVSITAAVADFVRGKIDAVLDDLGERQLKNIERPVRLFRVRSSRAAPAARLAPAAPERPSVAVLPFNNMSGDPEQEFFSDGITEDIITDLSRFRSLMVIARNSTFTFKGRSVRIQDVAKELGVAYVVEGSVRKAGDRVRITAQLIEAATGTHVWAQRYDRQLVNVFEIQDEISSSIVAAIAPQFVNAEVRRTLTKSDTDLGTWEMLMKARWHLSKPSREANARAQELLRAVLSRDKTLAQAHSLLALSNIFAFNLSWGDTAAVIAAAREAAHNALAIDNEDAVAHAIAGLMLAFENRHDEGIRRIQHAIQLNPNLAEAHGYLGVVHGLCGHYDACQAAVDHAFRLSPHDVSRVLWYAGLGIGKFVAGRYQDVVDLATEALREYPQYSTAWRQRCAAYAALDRMEEARADLAKLLELLPGLTIAEVRLRVPVRDPAAMETWLGALRKAGLPER